MSYFITDIQLVIFSCLTFFRYPDYNSIVEAGLMLPFGNMFSIILIC